MDLTRDSLAKLIDSTLLVSYAQEHDIEDLCNGAIENGFWGVCVNSFWVSKATALLRRKVRVCATVGFPLGACSSKIKTEEAKEAIENGADELDFVLNIGAIKSEKFDIVEDEVTSVITEARRTGATLNRPIKIKAIVETYLFLRGQDESEKEREAGKLRKTCIILKNARVDFIKTCTGFDTGLGKSKTTAEDVAFIRRVVGDEMGIKAAGGIHSLTMMLDLVRTGASRIGTSSAVEIMRQFDSIGDRSILL